MKEKKPYDVVAKVRKVVQYGGSFYISMPQEFVRFHGIKRGDRLAVLAGQIMKVIPMNE